MIIPNETEYTNMEICKECGGYCCKHGPGDFSPSDLGNSTAEIYSNILNGIRTGTLSLITRFLFKDNPYIAHGIIGVRPAVKKFVSKHWFGECVFLSDTGCVLSFKDRPIICRSLKPSSDLKCRLEEPSIYVYLRWTYYRRMLQSIRSIDKKMKLTIRKRVQSIDLYETKIPNSLV